MPTGQANIWANAALPCPGSSPSEAVVARGAAAPAAFPSQKHAYRDRSAPGRRDDGAKPMGPENSGAKADPGDDLPFACACGTVAGVLVAPGPRVGDHVVCHCSDCQAFATRLSAADHILDRHRGTALYQGRCASMRIRRGRDRLACLHLTAKPTLRWYAQCCDTPMFNSYRNGRVPYITVLVANCDKERRAELLRAPIGHLFIDEAVGDVRQLERMSMGRLMRRFFRRMVADIVSGDRRRSALFDPKTLDPINPPRRIPPA